MGLLTRAPVVVDSFALDEVKTYLRIDGESEDSALAALIVTAVEQCEAFVGQAILQRAMTEVLVPVAAWQMLLPEPVRAISGVVALSIGGGTSAVPPSAYEIDIDTAGRGRIRFLAPVVEKRVQVSFTAGVAASWSGLAESLRHGIVRQVAHFHAFRDRADELGPPAAVAALWRASRKVRLS
jgi:uncharacterized phiE125 gp8 family phage protein